MESVATTPGTKVPAPWTLSTIRRLIALVQLVVETQPPVVGVCTHAVAPQQKFWEQRLSTFALAFASIITFALVWLWPVGLPLISLSR